MSLLKDFNILDSAARTGDVNSPDMVNPDSRGLILTIDVTAVGAPAGNINEIRVQIKIGGNYLTVMSFGTLGINAVSRNAFLIYPGAATAGGWTAAPIQGMMPKNWRLSVDHTNESDSITYSVSGIYLP